MNFGLAIISSNGLEDKSKIIRILSNDLELFFKNKEYGNGIKSYTIGIVLTPPQYDKFTKIQKPIYTKGKEIIAPDGIPFTLEDNFEYDVKMDYDVFKDADESEAKKILAQKILESLSFYEPYRKKIKDFDIDRFKADLTSYFKERDLI